MPYRLREIEMFGFDADGMPVGGYGVECHRKRPAWTPRGMKRMLRADGAVRIVKRVARDREFD